VKFRHLKTDAIADAKDMERNCKEAKVQKVKGIIGGIAGYNILVKKDK